MRNKEFATRGSGKRVNGTGSTGSGWVPVTGDGTFSALGISGDPFNTTTFAPAVGLGSLLASVNTP